ncbi:ras and Rab interactor 1-like isoform X1 [Synchiropus splendidus]|uniref:ras and Rab interactor 1-like isoform X1 n=2 Tax=Synchiropus splendidus TaxID=270530 RepID=UPI00237DDC48|nr:ras and Rab interactor 1-like isoform X1 [Synchiropus splendidus]
MWEVHTSLRLSELLRFTKSELADTIQMALQEDPLYDFPEPSQSSQKKFLGHQRGRGSLRSISVLDRLLLTVPVWLQLSINPATALHILQREPPGTFLVRKSRTSQTNVLCVRLADDSVPSFVQQFGIREEHPTLSLETSAISFPDLPRLISFYCVSRDVLPFPLELPEAIAKATSHKELESISHMGIEFWNSHLNVRGPRSAPKSDEEKQPGAESSAPAAAPPLPAASPQLPPDADTQADSKSEGQESGQNPTLFHEFCPITTRSPLELDCGSGQGALCFINPLFLQSQNVLSRRRLCKRSLKVRVSTETSTLLSPPLAPPPPPPLLPKAKGLKRGAAKPNQEEDQSGQFLTADITGGPQVPEVEQPEDETLATIPEFLPSDYMDPTSVTSQPSLSPYLPPPLPAKASATHSPASDPPAAAPALSPYQFPSPSPNPSFFLAPCESAGDSPSLSPYQSPSPSPRALLPLSPFTSLSLTPLAEQVYDRPVTPSDLQIPEGEVTEGDQVKETCRDKQMPQEENHLVPASLNNTDSCSSFSSLEEAAEAQSSQ